MMALMSLSLLLAAGASGDDEKKPSPSTPVLVSPSPPPFDPTPKRATIPGPAPRATESADAGSLKGVQAVSIKEGEAQLRLADGLRTVRPGDTIGPDVVRRVSPGLIVLARGSSAQNPDGEAMVVVKFDEQGRSRVRVYYRSEPAAR